MTSIPAMTGIAGGMGPHKKHQRRLRYGGSSNGGVGKFNAEISSSENSVSVDASHSDDDIQVHTTLDTSLSYA